MQSKYFQYTIFFHSELIKKKKIYHMKCVLDFDNFLRTKENGISLSSCKIWHDPFLINSLCFIWRKSNRTTKIKNNNQTEKNMTQVIYNRFHQNEKNIIERPFLKCLYYFQIYIRSPLILFPFIYVTTSNTSTITKLNYSL